MGELGSLIGHKKRTLTMTHSLFLPEIETSLRIMPQAEKFQFLVRLVSAMIAGVALAGHDRRPSHPVRLCSQELVLMMQGIAKVPAECSTDALKGLAEIVGARIWRLAYFQSDYELAKKLESLVSPIFTPAPLTA